MKDARPAQDPPPAHRAAPRDALTQDSAGPPATDGWPLTPPEPSTLGDHDVPRLGDELDGRRIAMLVCGGIAAMKTPLVARALRKRGAEVTAFVSREALRYVAEDALAWSTDRAVVSRLSPQAEHLSDASAFDAYLLPQATYNTINKLAAGIADGVLTATLASALGRMSRGQASLLIAPTMHGSMHNPILTESLSKLHDLGVRIIPPRPGYGKHNIPDEPVLVAEVCRATATSPLAGQRILVTGGPTPVPIDGVRRIVTRFSGRTGVAIAEALYLRGARVDFVLGTGGLPAPSWLPHEVAEDFDGYRAAVHRALDRRATQAGVFAAAVADYRPQVVRPGKTPSGAPFDIALEATPKVIDEVRAAHPDLHMVTFKYQEGISHEALIAAARQRLDRFDAVVANRGEEMVGGSTHIAWLLTAEHQEPERLDGKAGIARAVRTHLERVVAVRADPPPETS